MTYIDAAFTQHIGLSVQHVYMRSMNLSQVQTRIIIVLFFYQSDMFRVNFNRLYVDYVIYSIVVFVVNVKLIVMRQCNETTVTYSETNTSKKRTPTKYYLYFQFD